MFGAKLSELGVHQLGELEAERNMVNKGNRKEEEEKKTS
jgi:hypothetical protein